MPSTVPAPAVSSRVRRGRSEQGAPHRATARHHPTRRSARSVEGATASGAPPGRRPRPARRPGDERTARPALAVGRAAHGPGRTRGDLRAPVPGRPGGPGPLPRPRLERRPRGRGPGHPARTGRPGRTHRPRTDRAARPLHGRPGRPARRRSPAGDGRGRPRPVVAAGEPVEQTAGRHVVALHGARDHVTSPTETADCVRRAREAGATRAGLAFIADGDHGMLRRHGLWHHTTAALVARLLDPGTVPDPLPAGVMGWGRFRCCERCRTIGSCP